MFIYLSQSYTCRDTHPPTPENIEAIRRGDLRILEVREDRLFGLRKDGTWKEIVAGNPLRQNIRHGCPLVEKETE